MESNDDFSEGVIVEILSRLPVKSLLRYRCVCELWYALIKSPSLISRHLKNYNDDNTRLVVNYVNASVYNEPTYVLFPDETLTDLSSYEVLDPLSNNCQELLGPCYGLFCFHDKNLNRMFLWNVATREFRALPKCKKVLPHPQRFFTYHCSIGFELDSLNNDYKIVFLRSLKDQFTYEFSVCTMVTMYTLSSDCWRYLKAAELNDYLRFGNTYGNTYLNKVCYWLVWCHDGNQVILSFHMRDEVFEEMQMPRTSCLTDPILGVYEKSLHLLGLDVPTSCFNILVMNRDNIWTKELTIGPILEVATALGFWKNGAFFIKSISKQLLVYDPNKQVLRNLGLKASLMSVYSHKESLVSINWDHWVVDFFKIPWQILGVYQSDPDSG